MQVGIIMGSDSDLPTMRAAAEALRDFGIACEVRVPPAGHRQRAAAAQPCSPATAGLHREPHCAAAVATLLLFNGGAPAAAVRHHARPSVGITY